MNPRVAWDASHGEFLISDYYYFSKLKLYAERAGIKLKEVHEFNELWNYDVVIFNYPEVSFREKEVERILEESKSIPVVFLAYYSNIDGVAENINRVVSKAGIVVENGVIIDERRNAGNPMFPIAEWRGCEVVMPCCAPVRGGIPLIVGKDVFAAKRENLVVFGTCVFWDNISIDLKDNRKLAISIFKGDI
ncbi:MAG: hypothetical protein DSY33_04860 [Archaeoglobus sp.]|nr:MAG: hypothetical protein DSY33_04860 [Archaeoglobus sp.]